MKIGICDDNPQDLKTLKAVLSPTVSAYATLECHGHGFALLESHCQKPFDILFLDIGMPHMNGIEVARELRLSCQTTHIIFVSQYRDFAAESYAVHAFSYLIKPFEAHDILTVFRQAEDKLLTLGRQLAVTTDYSTVYLPVTSIVYAETLQHKLRIHTYSQILDTRMTMQELTKQLDGHGFYRLHNSYLINLACVRAIQNRAVLLDRNIQIPIGKTRHVAEVKAAVLLWRRSP